MLNKNDKIIEDQHTNTFTPQMTHLDKKKIYNNIWSCAYYRRQMYRGTARELREHETLLMCLKIAKWWKYDTEKIKVL